MWRVSIKEYCQDGRGEWFWKTLCLVYRHEALGFLERLLQAGAFEFRITPEPADSFAASGKSRGAR